ncbi:hypothetical protein BLNAU_16690 [Blattamonas nauphoetae]|uniref:Uncharacterized protein n=1 Tax=Blattamonas nauphoetae TaxID=2049346 RepID=A0ABQ9XAC0_9EUKA|nr:hypothetical protein BLNAU_16690 [Blattamonas nauphoetae]
MQSPPMTHIIPPLSPTNRRAKTRRMRQVQMPECAEDVIGNLHRYPLLVWYDPTASKDSDDSLLNDDHMKTLKTLVASKCESGEEVEWQDLMEWFVCAVIGLKSKASWYTDSFWFDWEDVVVDGFGTARIKIDPLSQNCTQFIKLLDPELVEMKKRFDPNLIEEARRISSWKEFLEKVAGGEEVEELSYQSLLTNLSSHSIEISPMKWPTGPFDPNDCHEQPTFNSTLSSEWSYAFRNTQQSAL